MSARLAASLRYRGRLALRSCLEGALGVARRLPARGAEGGRVLTTLRRGLWAMSRSYSPASTGRAEIGGEFGAVLARVAGGEEVSADELLPYLCLEGLGERVEVNAQLADAFSQRPGGLGQARVFAQRAWTLSGGAPGLLPLYTQIFSALGETASIRAAYKRLGMRAAGDGDVSEALRYFDLWHHADHTFDNLDRYEYDFDVLGSVDRLAASLRPADPGPSAAHDGGGGRVRLAYLVKGAAELNSILVSINLELARLHDKEKFDVTFFFPETEEALAASPQGVGHLRRFEDLGCRVVTAPPGRDRGETLLGLAGKIRESRPHLLVTSAALADFGHYFVTALRPAPLVVGLLQGPPPQFAPPSLDWAIAWTKHPLMECPVGCSLVELKLDWPGRDELRPAARAELGVPEGACLLLSGGRHAKFQDASHWRAVGEVLAAHPEVFYVAVGPSEEQVPFLDSVIPREARPRVRCLGWRPDFINILAASDVVIDTYPSGGGQVLVQAMSLGIPILAHRNDYMTLYDQANWSPVEDFISDPELVVPRGDFERFRETLGRLIGDEGYRREAGRRCRELHAGQADPSVGVRRCEEIYLRLAGGRAAAGAGGGAR